MRQIIHNHYGYPFYKIFLKFSGWSAGLLLYPVLNLQENWEVNLFHVFSFECVLFSMMPLGLAVFPASL